MDLYFEMYSGIAGDMTIAALLDLGADRELLERVLASMNFGKYELIFSRVKKNGVDAGKFDVKWEKEGHPHRHLSDIYDILDQGEMSPGARKTAKEIFAIVAEAEAEAHGISPEEVHFHEVGAIDSIIDIVGVSVLMDDLAPHRIYFSDFYDGQGVQRCAHGFMPVPVPAVLNILKRFSFPLHLIPEEGERITPTGAAIAAYFHQGLSLPSVTVKNIGIGAGTSDFKKTTNVLRIMEVEDSHLEKTISRENWDFKDPF